MIIPTNRPLPLSIVDAGQREKKTNLEKQYDSFKIVEQSALDHFNSILQKAQKLAAKAEKNNSQK
jgi:hypothetical protein